MILGLVTQIDKSGSIVYGIAEWATILGFVSLMIGSILSPFVASKRTVKKVGQANGASSKAQLDIDKYKDYNLYDLALQSLVNSEKAVTASTEAKILAANAAKDVKKIVKHLGIDS